MSANSEGILVVTYSRLSRPDLRRYTPDLRVYVDRNGYHRAEVLTEQTLPTHGALANVLRSRIEPGHFFGKTLPIGRYDTAEHWLDCFDKASLVVEIVRS